MVSRPRARSTNLLATWSLQPAICTLLESDVDDRPAELILEEAHAILDEPDIEAHLRLRLQDADVADDLSLLARHEQILLVGDRPAVGGARRDRPAIRIALGRAAAVSVPVDSNPPEATRFDGVATALDRREHIVGAVIVAGRRAIGANWHFAGV